MEMIKLVAILVMLLVTLVLLAAVLGLQSDHFKGEEMRGVAILLYWSGFMLFFVYLFKLLLRGWI